MRAIHHLNKEKKLATKEPIGFETSLRKAIL